MKAMILAAGYGTRLKPITDKKPKALVEINNITLLQIVIQKLIASGVSEIIINTHHLAEKVENFVCKSDGFGIPIEISYEPEILGTGGGLKKASNFFDDGKPFFLHNVDILSTIDLKQMYQHHIENNAIATLALQKRETSRYFIMDSQNYICGHEDRDNHRIRLKRNPRGISSRMAFCGIHVISPKIFEFMDESGRFSIIDVYLKIIEKGLPIIGYPVDRFYWMDIGKLNSLNQVEKQINAGKITIKSLNEQVT